MAARRLSPLKFMKVWGFRRTTFWPSMAPRPQRALCFFSLTSIWKRSARASMELKPALCRVLVYLAPGFPRPATRYIRQGPFCEGRPGSRGRCRARKLPAVCWFNALKALVFRLTRETNAVCAVFFWWDYIIWEGGWQGLLPRRICTIFLNILFFFCSLFSDSMVYYSHKTL